jgi:hypothetical protein
VLGRGAGAQRGLACIDTGSASVLFLYGTNPVSPTPRQLFCGPHKQCMPMTVTIVKTNGSRP